MAGTAKAKEVIANSSGSERSDGVATTAAPMARRATTLPSRTTKAVLTAGIAMTAAILSRRPRKSVTMTRSSGWSVSKRRGK